MRREKEGEERQLKFLTERGGILYLLEREREGIRADLPTEQKNNSINGEHY